MVGAALALTIPCPRWAAEAAVRHALEILKSSAEHRADAETDNKERRTRNSGLKEHYRLADGSSVDREAMEFISLKFGDRIVESVTAIFDVCICTCVLALPLLIAVLAAAFQVGGVLPITGAAG
jgi:hypothetical protein